MPNNPLSVDVLNLSGQNVTAVGGTLYVNGVAAGGGGSSTNGVTGLSISGGAGFIDDVRIYNRALSQQEITTLYKAGTNKIV